MPLKVIDSIDQISAGQWQQLSGSNSVFLIQQFWLALEQSGSVGKSSGWHGHHLTMFDGASEQLSAILPSYIKTHSWGEFVFDWSWAEAFEQYGYSYYPKLVSTIPFTPITSDKLLSNDISYHAIVDQTIEHCQQQSINSWHLLFCPQLSLTRDDVFERHTVQFHWFNRNYHDFEHFLSHFNARKRKNTRKERLSITQQGIEIQQLTGSEITEQQLDFFYLCYQQSYFKRNHTPHLTKQFFSQIFSTLADNILLIIASHQGRNVASALFLFDDQQLYGRYWGCIESFNNLHFELCYYQGIEFCIKHQIQCFNPGAQGEHKIQRGFEPVLTHSYHWIKAPEFRSAIKDFCQRERQHTAQYFEQCQQALPFKKSD